MPKDRKFVNPLTRPTEKTPEEKSTDTSTYTDTSTSPYTSTYTPHEEQSHKRKDQTFEQLHERITLWVDKKLKRKFEALAEKERITKTALLNEAITDLLEKYRNR